MRPRERVLLALAHEEPDRVPIDVGSLGPSGIHAWTYRRLLDVLGREEETTIGDAVMQHARPSEAVLDLLGADVRGVRAGGPKGIPVMLAGNRLVDQWGTTWQMTDEGTCYAIVDAPLRNARTRADLRHYAWPDGKDPARVAGLAERARQLHETPYAVLGELSGHILERAQMIRGFDRFLEDLAGDPLFATDLMEGILATEIDIFSGFLDAVGPYLDIVAFKDDLAMQSGPVISPRMLKQEILPRLGKLVEVIRSKTKARVWFHSCGSISFAIPDLLDIGIEILNPVQVAARDMDTARLKRLYGKNLSFWGAIDTQNVLPFGTPQQVEAEVKQRIRDLAPGGGYVLGSVHSIEHDVPGENVWAMCRAAQKWGRYPLQLD